MVRLAPIRSARYPNRSVPGTATNSISSAFRMRFLLAMFLVLKLFFLLFFSFFSPPCPCGSSRKYKKCCFKKKIIAKNSFRYHYPPLSC
ncbi:MAG TPA: hypothetical protein ENG91_05210 [Desulfobacteraceae bacterium]|nr:hypothetical protein [Desulfobacteraceae bacterium]HDO30159.1 hypothetical protein [Desulfobacteraceae bacterium]